MKHLKLLIILIIACTITSCYSVRLRNINGTPQPDPFSNRDDYYRGMAVVELDTVIKINTTSKDFTLLIKESDACESGKLNMVEYRNTFGGLLLNTITFGKKRKVKIKYVCEKKSN
ncbi:hypothetical protein Q4Q35_00375 [Flavivirga aquimarina]|uniref:Lipoprotein n=1 Tax=Flavivirga aquimarina TaxID=2027862 RepID=A0ABT8W549_9FLAO|nr:hypothetical protein [Flavivirga aquimarina]MDO5968249.1 hypothetical protein [Flavivirga aquimarina]